MSLESRVDAILDENEKSNRSPKNRSELAKKIGKSPQWLTNILKEYGGKPKVSTLEIIAEALEVPLSTITGEPQAAVNEIRGRVIRGFGAASHSVKMQFPALVQCFPEIADCHQATINILLEKGVIFRKADFTTPAIPWVPGIMESFEFIRAKLRILEDDQGPITSWVYRPSRSMHRLNPCLVEILAPMIEGLKIGALCSVAFVAPTQDLSWVSVGI